MTEGEAVSAGDGPATSGPDELGVRWRELGIWAGTARRLVIEFESQAWAFIDAMWEGAGGDEADSDAAGAQHWAAEAARQLAVVAVDWAALAAKALGLPRPAELEHLDLVRDVLEHRDEYMPRWGNGGTPPPTFAKRDRAGSEFAERFPGQSPFDAVFIVGPDVHLTRSLTVAPVLAWLDELVERVARYSQSLGSLVAPAPPRSTPPPWW